MSDPNTHGDTTVLYLDELMHDRLVEEARTSSELEALLEAAVSGKPTILHSLLQNPAISDVVFDAIETLDVDVQLAMAQHPSCSPAALERLALSADTSVRQLARNHPRGTRVVEHWAETSEAEWAASGLEEPDTKAVSTSLLDPDPKAAKLYTETLEEEMSTKWELRRELAAITHPRAPGYVLERIVTKILPRLKGRRPATDERQRPGVARSDRYGADLDVLIEVAIGIAKHPNTSKAVLRRLSGVPSARVQVALARNPNTPLPNLKRLVAIDDATIQSAVARHRSKAVRSLESRLLGCCDEVLAALASNPFTRYRTLKWLLERPPSADVLAAIARNPALEADDLEELAETGDERVLAQIARNGSTDPNRLRSLAAIQSAPIHEALALNTATPPDALHTIFKSALTEKSVQRVLANPAVSEWTVEDAELDGVALYGLAANPAVRPELQLWLADMLDPEIQCYLTANENATAEALVRALTSAHSNLTDYYEAPADHLRPKDAPEYFLEVATKVARHANASTETLAFLADQQDERVSFTARISLLSRV